MTNRLRISFRKELELTISQVVLSSTMRRASWTRLAVVKAAGLGRANGADRHCQMGTECHAVDAAANCVDQGDVSHLFRCLILTRLHWRSRIVCLPLGDLLPKAGRVCFGPWLRRRVWCLNLRRGVARESPSAVYYRGPNSTCPEGAVGLDIDEELTSPMGQGCRSLWANRKRSSCRHNCLQIPY